MSLQSFCHCKVCATLKVVSVPGVQCLCRYKVFPATKFVSLQSLCRCKVCVAAKFASLQSLCRYEVCVTAKFALLQSLGRYLKFV